MAKTRHSYVRVFPSDWIAGTARMPRLHKSVYFDICMYIWDTAKPCPATELPLMLGDLPNWRDIVEDLVAAGKLDRSPDGSVANKRAIAEAQHSFDLWEKKSTGGRKGAAITNNSGSGDGSPDGTPVGSGDGSGPGVPSQNQNQNHNKDNTEGFTNIERARNADDVEWPADLIEFTQECCRIGGVPHNRAGRIIADQAIVRGWREAEIPDADIITVIKDSVSTAAEGISSLRYYDAAVRTAHARTQAREGGHNGAAPRTTEPVDPMVRAATRRAQAARGAEDSDRQHEPELSRSAGSG